MRRITQWITFGMCLAGWCSMGSAQALQSPARADAQTAPRSASPAARPAAPRPAGSLTAPAARSTERSSAPANQAESTARKPAAEPRRPADAVADVQQPRDVPVQRVEQQLTQHDRAEIYSGNQAPAVSPVLAGQPKEGQLKGFDFARDPLNADHPMQPAEEIMRKESEARPSVNAAQRKLLESRYDLTPRRDANAKMSRGKPLCVGPTARLAQGLTWEQLGQMSPADIRRQKLFPYPSLPHPLHTNGGQVFPQAQIEMFPRLQRFDVDFDIPEEFLPEFPPAIFLQNRPELGDGPIKTFTLRGIKDSPPYLHDGRCLTLEDTVEFFNLVLELQLTAEEKTDLVAFMRQL